MTDADIERAKINAAAAAIDYVEGGMVVGLGSGSTAAHFVRQLAQRKFNIVCVATSQATHDLAESVGLRIISADTAPAIHVTVDGADEIDAAFRLIKGGGGALLREKIVAAASGRMVVIADEGKLVDTLGRFPLPVEVAPFALALTAQKIYQALVVADCAGRASSVREIAPGRPFLTDNGNHIIDCKCERIPRPETLAEKLNEIPGVVEHGLFLGMARTVILGRPGNVEIRER